MKRAPRANPYRDRWAGDLRADAVGTTVTVPAGCTAAVTTAG